MRTHEKPTAIYPLLRLDFRTTCRITRCAATRTAAIARGCRIVIRPHEKSVVGRIEGLHLGCRERWRPGFTQAAKLPASHGGVNTKTLRQSSVFLLHPLELHKLVACHPRRGFSKQKETVKRKPISPKGGVNPTSVHLKTMHLLCGVIYVFSDRSFRLPNK